MNGPSAANIRDHHGDGKSWSLPVDHPCATRLRQAAGSLLISREHRSDETERFAKGAGRDSDAKQWTVRIREVLGEV
ncbi:hypothetical protein MRX96_032824 [Rhipicephalus microplus]